MYYEKNMVFIVNKKNFLTNFIWNSFSLSPDIYALYHLISACHLDISKVLSHSFTGAPQAVHSPLNQEVVSVSSTRGDLKRHCKQRRRGRTVCGRAPVAAIVRCVAARAENFGYERDLRSLTRWQWSVMVTGERPTTSPSVRRIARSFTRHYLGCYVRARSTRARNISSPSWTSPERVTRKICLVHGGKPWCRASVMHRTCSRYGMWSKFRGRNSYARPGGSSPLSSSLVFDACPLRIRVLSRSPVLDLKAIFRHFTALGRAKRRSDGDLYKSSRWEFCKSICNFNRCSKNQFLHTVVIFQ